MRIANFFFLLVIFPLLNLELYGGENESVKERLFIEKRCITCHVIGRGRFVGPDLYNVFDKYSEKEIAQWIQNPQALYKKYSKIPINDGYPPMPNLNVGPEDAKKLLEYIKETKESINRGTKVKISGNIKNFTKNKFLNAQEVQLESVMADKVISTKKVATMKGEFSFDKLIGNIAYRIKIFYDGIEYSTDKFYFLPDENNKLVDLTVFDSTQDIKNIALNSTHLIISYEEASGSIIIAEIINVDNKSKSIFVGSNDFSEKVREINSYSLFPGISDLGFPHRGEDTFLVSETNVVDTLPMPPGNRRIVFTYSKRLNMFSTNMKKTFLNNIDSLTIIVPENKLSFEIKGLKYLKKETQIKELADESYTTYSISNIKKGDIINLQFKKYDLLFNPKVIIGSIFILFILVVLGLKRLKYKK